MCSKHGWKCELNKRHAMHAEEDARMHDERKKGDWQRSPIHSLSISSDIHASNARVVKRERAKSFHVFKKRLKPSRVFLDRGKRQKFKMGQKKFVLS